MLGTRIKSWLEADWGTTNNYNKFISRLGRFLEDFGFVNLRRFRSEVYCDLAGELGALRVGFVCRVEPIYSTVMKDCDELSRHEFYANRKLIIVVARHCLDDSTPITVNENAFIIRYDGLQNLVSEMRDRVSPQFLPCLKSTTALAPVFRPRQILKEELAPAAKSIAPLPLLSPAFAPRYLREWHDRAEQYAVSSLACYYCSKLKLTGPGIPVVEKGVVLSDEFLPRYVQKALGFDVSSDPPQYERLQVAEFEGPCLSLLGWGTKVYGHFLIENLFRLLIARRVLLRHEFQFDVLLDVQTPSWLLTILAEQFGLGRERLRFVNSKTEIAVVQDAILSTLASRSGIFHPFANDLIDSLVDDFGPRSAEGRRIFISRSQVKQGVSISRHCKNAEEIESAASHEFGCEIVNLETYSWRDQICMFRDAELIIGEFGSGLHNALFSPAGTKVLSIGLLNLEQSHIGSLRQHRNGYLDVNLLEPGGYTVNLDLLRKFVQGAVSTSTSPSEI